MDFWSNYKNNLLNIYSPAIPLSQSLISGSPEPLVSKIRGKEDFKPSVSKTMVVPDYIAEKAAEEETKKLPASSDVLALLQASSLASSPSKTVQTTTPYARDDMLARRAKIGEYNQALEDAMKIKEGVGYSIANALAGIPQQQGYGTWLSDFARAFGGGMKSASDAAINRQKTMADLALKDIDTALKLDKEMGDTIVKETYGSPDLSTQLALSLLNME